MSNPFAVFRKNQRTWMAILVLVAIFAFVIAPVFDYFNRGSGGGYSDSAVAVKWKGGQMTRGDLVNRIQKHSSLVRFMSEISTRVLEQGGVPDVPRFRYDPATRQVVGLGIQFSSTPQDVVRTKMLAAHGKSLGVAFDDNAVDQFMQAYVDNKLSSDEVSSILRDASNGNLTYFEVREMLKDELSSMVVQQMAMAGLFSDSQSQLSPIVSPGKTFEDYKKLNQSAKVEAFPVFADDYLDQVTETPSSDEIDAIYMIGSQTAPNPNSPEPGFMRRYAANVEYVEANLQEWIDREKEKLTDEEIRKEYDRRVELGQLKVPVETEEPESGDTDESTDPATTDGEGTDAEATEFSGDASADGESDSQESSSEAAEESTSTEEERPPSPKKPNDDDQSSLSSTSKIHFTSAPIQEEEASEESEDQGTTEEAANPTDAGGEEATEDASSQNGPPPVVQPPQLGSETSESEGADSEASSEPEMRTQTFEEAKDAIATSLARDKAIPALDEALTTLLEDHMKPYYGAYRQYRAFIDSGLEQTGEEREAPVKPNVKKLATDLGLKWSETGLVDGVAIAQTPFGLGNIRPDESGLSGSVANVVMSPGVESFRPMQSSYFDQAAIAQGEMPEFLQYLLWKTEERQAYIPEQAEIQDEIVDAWKQLKARKLAENAANELAKKVTDGASPWEGALSGNEQSLIIETDPFTWMNRLGDFMMISAINKLEPVGGVGGEFMREVFSTEVNGVAVGPSANRNIYYVFRVLEVSPEDKDLQDRFSADPLKAGPKRIAFEETQRLFGAWVENLEQDLELEWQMNVGQLN